MATLAQFRNELAAVLGLDNRVSRDQPLMDQFINEGVTDVVLKTHCKVLPFEMDTIAGIGNYTLPTLILVIIELNVTSSSTNYAVQRVTQAELLQMRLNTGATNSPTRYYATSGANLLMLHPAPSRVDTVTGIYVPRPRTLALDTDTPTEIPAEWHKAVSFYALHRSADMDDDVSSEHGERYRQYYMQAIQEMRPAVYKHGGLHLPPARVLPRTGRIAKDPSVVNW